MTLIDLLTLMTWVGFIAAIMTGKEFGALGICIGFLVGAVIGTAFSITLKRGFFFLFHGLSLQHENTVHTLPRLILSWLLLGAACAWIALSGVTGVLSTGFVLHIAGLK